MASRIIDVHAHAVFEETLGAAGDHGPELVTDGDGQPLFRAGGYCLHGVRYRGSAFMDPEKRLLAMDEAGIDLQVLSPNPLTYFHFVESDVARSFCRLHNDTMARLVKRYPDRLAGFAALPMQDPAAAIDELKRSREELGLLGAYIGTDFGIDLDSAELDPFYRAAVKLDVPVFLHPAPMGIDGPDGDTRLRRFDLDLTLGFAFQEALAIAILVFGGVLERHPDLDLCVSHGGGATPFLAGRMAAATRKRAWASPTLREKGGYEAQLSRLWYDVHVHDPLSLDLLATKVGTDRLVFGTNFAGWDQGETPKRVPDSLDLTANARRLLRLT